MLNYSQLRKPSCRSTFFNSSPLEKCWYGKDISMDDFISAITPEEEKVTYLNEHYCFYCGHVIEETSNRVLLGNHSYAHRACYK